MEKERCRDEYIKFTHLFFFVQYAQKLKPFSNVSDKLINWVLSICCVSDNIQNVIGNDTDNDTENGFTTMQLTTEPPNIFLLAIM